MSKMERGVNVLSPEALSQVLEQVQLSQAGSGGLGSCLLVCRQWRDIGLRILYRSLVLDTNRLRRLLACFDRAAVSTSTRHLTIQITRPWPEWETGSLDVADSWQAQGEAVDRVLSRVPSELLSVAGALSASRSQQMTLLSRARPRPSCDPCPPIALNWKSIPSTRFSHGRCLLMRPIKCTCATTCECCCRACAEHASTWAISAAQLLARTKTHASDQPLFRR